MFQKLVTTQCVTFRGTLRSSIIRNVRNFQLPQNYKPNTEVITKLPFSKLMSIWFKSLNSNRLYELQQELIMTMVPKEFKENQNIQFSSKKVPIDSEGNYINEINCEIINDKSKPTRHVVFIHGYGASLGCFSRNFQIVNKFKGMNSNYCVHFLDNISFGLSSNKKIKSNLIDHWKIPRCPEVKLNDNEPTDPKKLYNKYYKLVESFEINKSEFEEYQQKFKPILNEIEQYYIQGIENWRKASNIDVIDCLIGHSYGGYWSSSYTLKHENKVKDLILLSPVGVEKHVHAVTNPLDLKSQLIKPTLDPSHYNFLSRIPIVPSKQVDKWYAVQPFLPRLLKFLGPFGVSKYYDMWYLKLFKINKLISKRGKELFTNNNDLVYGTNKECQLIIEYLYNSITNGTNSDIYIKYLLTPSTVSKYPLFDKFTEFKHNHNLWPNDLRVHFLYGQYDFMNAEAGSKLIDTINDKETVATIHKISEGGHNLYIDNPFETNNLIHEIAKKGD